MICEDTPHALEYVWEDSGIMHACYVVPIHCGGLVTDACVGYLCSITANASFSSSSRESSLGLRQEIKTNQHCGKKHVMGSNDPTVHGTKWENQPGRLMERNALPLRWRVVRNFSLGWNISENKDCMIIVKSGCEAQFS
jgi:hypothetical protein